jgi:ComEC/Rec2-related protein
MFFPPALLALRGNHCLRYAGCFLCGFLWSGLCAHGMLAERLSPELEGKTLTVTGRVASLPEYRSEDMRFEFLPDNPVIFAGKEWPAPRKIRLTWYRHTKKMQPGQHWQLRVKLKRPHGFMNPGSFDYEQWLFQHRIGATGYVADVLDNRDTGITSGEYVDRLRYQLRERIHRSLEHDRYGGLILALVLGDRSLISAGDRNTMINTGTYHLLAISGMHISLVAGLAYLIALRLWSWTGFLPVRFAAQRFAALLAMMVAVLYALIAGFSIPTQRALIMLAVIMFAVYTRRRYATSYIYCTALLLVLIYDPFAVMDPGFWLSFGAIALLIYGMSCRVAVSGIWWRWGRAQYVGIHRPFAGFLVMVSAIFSFGNACQSGYDPLGQSGNHPPRGSRVQCSPYCLKHCPVSV